MIKKQKWTILIGAVVFVALLLSYIFIFRPMLKPDDPIDEPPPELLPGEVLGTSNRILLFEHVERTEISSIEVHNREGEYKFYYSAKDNEFFIEGLEGAPYSLESLANLVVSAGNTLSLQRITTDCADLSEYGLAPADDPAWYVLTKRDGTQYKVWIGDKTVSGSGYYVRYDGRNAVYILDYSIETTLLSGVYSLITPVLGLQLDQDSYMRADDFFVLRNGELAVFIDYIPESEMKTEAGVGTWKMLYPGAGKFPLHESNYGSILEIFTSFMGEETVEFAPGMSDEDLKKLADLDAGKSEEEESSYAKYLREKYGIDFNSPAYLIHYSLDGLESYVVFSKPALDGSMYAFSSLYDLVAKVNIANFQFLEWDTIRYVHPTIMAENINDVAKITFVTDGMNAEFTIAGTAKEGLEIRSNLSDRKFGTTQIRSFQEWYRELVGIYLQDYVETDELDSLPLLATMTYTTRAGVTHEYKFYPYTTRHVYFTVDGEGLFYVLIDDVEKIIGDCGRLLRGEVVNADIEY